MRGRYIASIVLVLVCAAPARAELVFFANGRSLNVKSHRVDGDTLVLQLRSGGEIVCDRSVISEIKPDEVPYPEPQPPQAAAVLPIDPGTAYSDLIDTLSIQHGVPSRLVKALIKVESGYQPRARSRRGAMGLMQLMPETARQYGVADPYDPRANIEAGIKHLKSLIERLPLDRALAAYNAGEAAVQRFGGVPPYAETRDYVSRIIKLFGASKL